LKEIEFKEIAFMSSCAGTSDGISAWYTGMKSAVPVPDASETRMIIQTCTTPLKVSAARSEAARASPSAEP
jgi:hypothetical protein